MGAALRAQDHLYTLIEKGAGEPSAAVIGSIVGFVHAPPGREDAVAALVAAPATAILSLTVTEGGYAATGRTRRSTASPPRWRCAASAVSGR